MLFGNDKLSSISYQLSQGLQGGMKEFSEKTSVFWHKHDMYPEVKKRNELLAQKRKSVSRSKVLSEDAEAQGVRSRTLTIETGAMQKSIQEHMFRKHLAQNSFTTKRGTVEFRGIEGSTEFHSELENLESGVRFEEQSSVAKTDLNTRGNFFFKPRASHMTRVVNAGFKTSKWSVSHPHSPENASQNDLGAQLNHRAPAFVLSQHDTAIQITNGDEHTQQDDSLMVTSFDEKQLSQMAEKDRLTKFGGVQGTPRLGSRAVAPFSDVTLSANLARPQNQTSQNTRPCRTLFQEPGGQMMQRRKSMPFKKEASNSKHQRSRIDATRSVTSHYTPQREQPSTTRKDGGGCFSPFSSKPSKAENERALVDNLELIAPTLKESPHTQVLLKLFKRRHSQIDQMHHQKLRDKYAKQYAQASQIDKTMRQNTIRHACLLIDPISQVTQDFNLKVKREEISNLVNSKLVHKSKFRLADDSTNLAARSIHNGFYGDRTLNFQDTILSRGSKLDADNRLTLDTAALNAMLATQPAVNQAAQWKKERQEIVANRYKLKKTPSSAIKMLDNEIENRKRLIKAATISLAILNGLDWAKFQKDAEKYLKGKIGRNIVDARTEQTSGETSNLKNCQILQLDTMKTISKTQHLSTPSAEPKKDEEILCRHQEAIDEQVQIEHLKEYVSICKFQQKLKGLDRQLSKKQILELLKTNFNRDLLTDEELDLFDTDEKLEKAFYAPLRFLEKHGSQAKLIQEQKNEPVGLSLYDNFNYAEYQYERGVVHKDAAFLAKHQFESERYCFEITPEAKDYMQRVVDSFPTKTVAKTVRLTTPTSRTRQPTNRIQKTKDYNQRRAHALKGKFRDILMKKPHLLAEEDEDSKEPEVGSSTSDGHASRRGLGMPVEAILQELKTNFEKFEKGYCRGKLDFHYLDYDLEHQLRTRKKLPNNVTKYLPVAQKRALSPRDPADPLAEVTLSGNRLVRLSQAQEDILINQEKTTLMHQENADKAAFFKYSKHWDNEFTKSAHEEAMLAVMKQFFSQMAKPTGILSKIQNNELRVKDQPLTEVDAKVYGVYLWNLSKDVASNLRVLSFCNCGLKDRSLAHILKGVEAQQRLVELHLEKEEVEAQSLEVVLRLLARAPPRTLQSLSLASCRTSRVNMQEFLCNLKEQPTHLSKFKLKDFFMADKPKCVEYLAQFIAKVNFYNESQLQQQVMTHLWLEELGLTVKELTDLLEVIQDNKSLQFLSLSGNKLEVKKEQEAELGELLENQLAQFIITNREQLTHLDFSDLVTKQTPRSLQLRLLDILFDHITMYSKSLQSVHLDGWKLEGLDHFLHSQRLIIKLWDHPDPAIQAEYRIKREQLGFALLSKKTVECLISNKVEVGVMDKINEVAIYKAREPKCSHIFDTSEEILILYRDLNSTKYDFNFTQHPKCAGLFRPTFTADQAFGKWTFAQDCRICSNLQRVHLFFSPDDPSYQKITNPKVVEALVNQLRDIDFDLEMPLLLGSMATPFMKTYEMIPTQVWLLSLIRPGLLLVERDSQERLTEAILDRFYEYVVSTRSHWDQVAEAMFPFANVIPVVLKDYHHEMRRMTNFLSWPQKEWKDSFCVQIYAEPGPQSVVVLDPKTQAFYCKNVIIAERQSQQDCAPAATDLKQSISEATSETLLKHQLEYLKARGVFMEDFDAEDFDAIFPHCEAKSADSFLQESSDLI